MTNADPSPSSTTASDLLQWMAEAVIFADTQGVIRMWNPGAESLLGYSAEEVLGRSLDIIIPERLRQAHWDGYDRALAQGAAKNGRRSMVTRALHRNGTSIYVDMSFAVVRNSAGELSGAVAVASDASERYLEEKDLRRQLRELQGVQAKQ